jgi:hypothetical protein
MEIVAGIVAVFITGLLIGSLRRSSLTLLALAATRQPDNVPW